MVRDGEDHGHGFHTEKFRLNFLRCETVTRSKYKTGLVLSEILVLTVFFHSTTVS